MSGICGWFSSTQAGFGNETTVDSMVEQLVPFRPETVTRETTTTGALAAAGLASSANRHGQIMVAIQGCPIWASTASPAWRRFEDFNAGCVAAYHEAGADFLKHIDGPFAMALIDCEKQRLLLALDRTGTESLCYLQTPHGIVFGTLTDALTAHPAIKRELDPQAIFNYVYFHVVPGPHGVFKDVRKLLPGHYLQIDNGSAAVNAYWQANYRNITYESFAERKRTLQTLLRDSVSDALCGGRVGAFLSGGTDSSTIAGVLSAVLEQGAPTYSIGFDAPGYDESEFARTASRHFKTNHREYYVTPQDVVRAVPLMASAFDAPFGNASAIPAYYCAKLAAEDGIDTLLGGDGGDELFGGNARYAKQWVFSLYDQVPKALRKAVVEPMLSAMPASGPVRKAQSYVQQANLGMPDRMESYNLLERLGVERVFKPEFVAEIDPERPIRLIQEIYHEAEADHTLNRMLALDMRLTLADNDLRKVTRACDAAGVAVTFPLLDRRLMEFAQTLPPDWKVKRTKLRDFFKRALSDFLPEQVISKSKHGFGLPFGVWLQSDAALHALANDSLLRLRNRDIIQPKFIDDLTSKHLEQHAAYFGTMVWILMMLEQWLESRDL